MRSPFSTPCPHCPNQTLLRAQIDDWLDNERRSAEARHAALVVVDIDRFLRINTSFGYDAGNVVLREVVSRLIERAGKGAMIARLSGDRFCVFAPSCSTRDDARLFRTQVAGGVRVAGHQGRPRAVPDGFDRSGHDARRR
jgi:diguanylate cyclase (GGDEF)-like protein